MNLGQRLLCTFAAKFRQDGTDLCLKDWVAVVGAYVILYSTTPPSHEVLASLIVLSLKEQLTQRLPLICHSLLNENCVLSCVGCSTSTISIRYLIDLYRVWGFAILTQLNTSSFSLFIN